MSNIAPGRFNDVGDGPTQYLSLHPHTPWAEMLRNEGRRTREQALQMRVALWALRVHEQPLELTFDTAPEHGLRAADLVADDHSACRRLAQRLRGDGVASFLAPSAALPGTRNLVVLQPRVMAGWETVPVDALDWPGALAAQEGHCPDGLWDVVRHRGARVVHPALAAWRAGGSLSYSEPPVALTGEQPGSRGVVGP